jgi:hypothetical protein
MARQRLDSNLKDKDYGKWVEGQSTEALEKESRTLELRQLLLPKKDPEEEARLLDDNGEAEWEALTPEQQAEAARNTLQELEKPESLKQDEYIMKLYADPEKLAQFEAERQAQLAAMEPEERAQLLGQITPWITEQLEIVQHLEAVRRELNVRRSQELSKGRKRSKRTPMVERRREIVQALSRDGFHAPDICEELDRARIPLPQGPDWEKYRRHARPWTDAYRLGGEKLRGRIRTIFSKDKKP